MDRKLQRHRADSLRQHGFLVLQEITAAFVNRMTFTDDLSNKAAKKEIYTAVVITVFSQYTELPPCRERT